MDFDVKNIDLAPGGRHRIEWAELEMPVLRGVQKQFKNDRPFAGLRIRASAPPAISRTMSPAGFRS